MQAKPAPPEPIIKRALGADWARVPQVLQRNFGLTPGRDDETRLTGRMTEVSHSRLAKLFVWPGQLFGALVPWQGRDIRVRIDIRTHALDSRYMYWHRAHAFAENPEFLFSSKMEYLEGNEFIERVRFGLGLRMRASVDAGVLRFESVCYQWDLWKLRLKLPNWLLLGTGVILERELGPDEFEMVFTIDHPWFGRTFTYAGVFRFV